MLILEVHLEKGIFRHSGGRVLDSFSGDKPPDPQFPLIYLFSSFVFHLYSNSQGKGTNVHQTVYNIGIYVHLSKNSNFTYNHIAQLQPIFNAISWDVFMSLKSRRDIFFFRTNDCVFIPWSLFYTRLSTFNCSIWMSYLLKGIQQNRLFKLSCATFFSKVFICPCCFFVLLQLYSLSFAYFLGKYSMGYVLLS